MLINILFKMFFSNYHMRISVNKQKNFEIEIININKDDANIIL